MSPIIFRKVARAAGREHVSRTALFAAVIVAMLFVAWLGWQVIHLTTVADDNARALKTAQSEREALRAKNDRQDRDIAKRNTAITRANKQLKDAGKKPVTIPDQPVAVPDVAGQPVLTSQDVLTLIEAEVKTQRPGLTEAQRQAVIEASAVRAATLIPKARDGKDGRAGRDAPTLADLRPIISAEVAKIPTPADGQDGTNGTNGEDGQPGRTPSAEEVQAALVTLCGGSCRGPQGETGAAGKDSTTPGPAGPSGPAGRDGANGTDGRGLSSLACDDAGELVATYSDGSTQTVTGATACKQPTPAPDPQPTPTPTPTG